MGNESILEVWANAIQGLLEAGHAVVSSTTDHNLLLGDAREVMIKDFLMRFLPSSLVVGTGQLIDSKGSLSNQIDIVIYRSSFPIFRTLGSSDVFLLEGVVATIEVKSTLSRSELNNAVDNCVSVKSLSPCYDVASVREYCDRHQLQFAIEGSLPDVIGPAKDKVLEEVMPSTYIFGYKGYSLRLKDLEDAVYEWYAPKRLKPRFLPDVISTEGCVVVRNDGRPFRALDERNWIYLARRDSAPIKYLLKHLLHRLGTSVGLSVAQDIKSGIVLRSDAHATIDTSGDWDTWWALGLEP
jgi:hypothetical protein